MTDPYDDSSSSSAARHLQEVRDASVQLQTLVDSGIVYDPSQVQDEDVQEVQEQDAVAATYGGGDSQQEQFESAAAAGRRATPAMFPPSGQYVSDEMLIADTEAKDYEEIKEPPAADSGISSATSDAYSRKASRCKPRPPPNIVNPRIQGDSVSFLRHLFGTGIPSKATLMYKCEEWKLRELATKSPIALKVQFGVCPEGIQEIRQLLRQMMALVMHCYCHRSEMSQIERTEVLKVFQEQNWDTQDEYEFDVMTQVDIEVSHNRDSFRRTNAADKASRIVAWARRYRTILPFREQRLIERMLNQRIFGTDGRVLDVREKTGARAVPKKLITRVKKSAHGTKMKKLARKKKEKL